MRLDEEQSVTQVLLETIACAMTRATLSHFLPSFIGLLKLAIEIAHPDECDMVEAIVSRFILRLVKLIGTLNMEQGDGCLKQLLTCMKHTVTSREHVNFIVDAILRFDDDDKYNVHTIATILSFIDICYASQLAQSTKSAIYAKLVTFLRQNKKR